ncbi:MAG: IS1595 family transposase [Bacilli bacterium]|nr:IS1595 family transposase [Bacilli bacterium]
MNLEDIKREIHKLDKDDQEEIVRFIKESKLENNYTALLIKAIETKYSDEMSCPYCKSNSIKKDGHYKNGLQRYKCKDCNHTFSPYVNTILENTKLHPIVWLKYLIIMSEDEDLRDCAKYAGVSLKGSFYMRHKIMNAMDHEMENKELDGIVELDEMSVNISYSGNHQKQNEVEMPRRSYSRGRKGHAFSNDSKITDSIIIATAVDRQRNIFMKVAKIGTTTLDGETIKNIYMPHLKKATTLCTDGLMGYRLLAKELNIEHKAFATKSKEKRGIYHINNVNYIHSKVNEYFRKHNGISSKYLNEYLALISYRLENKLRAVEDYFIDLYTYMCTFRRKNYIGTGFVTDSIALG